MTGTILRTIEQNPIIAAVKNSEGLERVLTRDNRVVFLLYGDLCSLPGTVERLHQAGKLVIVHTDLITGLAAKEVAVDYVAAVARADGSAPTVLVIRATGVSCKVKGSEGNVLGEMLAGLGCVNVADSDAALLEDLSLEAIIKAEPDYIFAVLQGSDPTDAMATLESTLLTNPAWSQLKAVQDGRFYTLEHELYNLKPNARWGEAYEKLADILYP